MGNNNLFKDIVIIFIITALWDVILRMVSEGKIYLFGIEKMKWITVLEDYFEEHTVLGAALIAGFVGAITHALIILALDAFKLSGITLYSTIIVLFVSGIVGIPMRYSKLFPHLKMYYYDRLGFQYSFASDAFSGVVVAATYQVMKLLK
jgi:hypothetical protein